MSLSFLASVSNVDRVTIFDLFFFLGQYQFM